MNKSKGNANMTMKMMVAAVGMIAALSASAFPQSIAYSGVVRRADGKLFERAQNVPMTFRLYDSFAPDAVVWARTIPVRVDTNGLFNVELSDSVGTSALPKGQSEVPLERACANVSGSVIIGLTMAGSEEGRVWSEEGRAGREEEFRETLTAYPQVEHAAFARTTPVAQLTKLQSEMVVVKGNMEIMGNLLVPPATSFGKLITYEVGNRFIEVGSPDKPVTLYGGLGGWSYLGTTQSPLDPNAKNDRARLAFLKCEKEVKYGPRPFVSDERDMSQKTSIPFNVFTRPPLKGTAPVEAPAGSTITGIQYF